MVMAADKPFRTSPATKGQTHNGGEKASPIPGKHVVRSRETGEPLPSPSDLPAGVGRCYSPPIPWPPEGEQAARKPFKIGGA